MSNLYPLLVPFAPLLAALVSALPLSYFGARNYKIGKWIMLSSFVGSLLLLWQVIQNPEPIHLTIFNLPSEILPVVEMYISRLSVVMMVVISGFGAILYHYSTRYLQQDAGLRRYQTMFALKLSLQLFLVSSADLLTLFIYWQLINWFLCLLSHNYAHAPTAQGSFRTFIMLRFGDLAFLAGIVLAYNLYGTVQLVQLFERATADQTSFALLGSSLEISGATAIAMLIFIGAMSKSAQFPLHMWLPDSLYAPTPIHALLHAGGVNAGGFLLTRLAPLFILSPATLHFVLFIGLITAIFGSSMMLVQNDIKKSLGYSTIGQMGYMIMECGLGAFSLAIFHLIAHGFFKADIFLNCGKGIQEARLHPENPPEPSAKPTGWFSAFLLSLIIPLLITIGAHYLLGIPFSPGFIILLIFSWVTTSQAMLTLFRLNKTLVTKGTMLIGASFVITLYFFAAEQFTYFLNPDHNVVASYFKAAELPNGIFLALASLLILSTVIGWLFSLQGQGQDDSKSCLNGIKNKIYLLLMNRLYMDVIASRLFAGLKRIGEKLEQSSYLLVLAFIVILATAFTQGFLPAISALAIIGAIWGSLKALLQVRVFWLLIYGLLAQYSILLWHFAQAGGVISAGAESYGLAVTLTWAGLFFAWDRIRVRYGDLDLNQIGGLFQTMPRFALFMSLLIMAAVGLPPFGLSFAYLGILLSPASDIATTVLIITTWFLACWYLYRLMQQLLFGAPRQDIYYDDLRPHEIIVFIVIIVLLLVPGTIPQDWLMEVIQ